MYEQMEFPKTFEKFAKDYGFKDDKEVYTNGSDLIPIFRVKQWLEHDNKLRAIETDTAYECGKHANEPILTNGDVIQALENKDYPQAFDMAIEALEQEPCEEDIHREKEQAYMLGYEDASKKFRTEPYDDVISRQAVYDLMRSLTRWCVRSEDGKFNNVGLLYDDVMFGIDKLPSVNPQEPKWDRLYSWLNDMRFGIAPDETVTDVDERNERMAQADLLDEIMEWIEKAVWEKKSEDEDEQGTN